MGYGGGSTSKHREIAEKADENGGNLEYAGDKHRVEQALEEEAWARTQKCEISGVNKKLEFGKKKGYWW